MTGHPTSRVPAGVPTGGQFTPSAHAEAHLTLVEPYEPQPLETLVPHDGSPYVVSGHESGSEVYDAYEITRVDGSDAFRVAGRIDVDLVKGMAETHGWTEETAEAWLTERKDTVNTELFGYYDVEVDYDAADWMRQPVRITREVPCDYREDNAIDAVEDHRGTHLVYHDLTFPQERGIAPDLYRRLRDMVEAADRRRANTMNAAEAEDFLLDHYLAGNIRHEEYLATCSDDDASREATDSLLRRFGQRLEGADNVEQATTKAAERSPEEVAALVVKQQRLRAEWDEAFAALRAAGLDHNADHPVAERYRDASDAVNHVNRKLDFHVATGQVRAVEQDQEG